MLGLSFVALVSGCSETETTLSVNVRYWTNYLEASSFKVLIEQDGREALDEEIVPRDLGEGKYDVVCDHNWELDYCRFYKRIDLAGWSESDVSVTFSGKTKDGKEIADDVASRGIADKLTQTFELKANEVNVIYFQLPNVNTPPDPVSPVVTPDADAATPVNDAGATTEPAGDGGTSGATDAGAEAGSGDGGTSDAASTGDADVTARDAAADSGLGDSGAVDASRDAGDAAPDADDAN